MSILDSFRLKNCIYHFSKHTGQHNLSLLTFFNVPVDEVCQKLEKMQKRIFENWKISGFLKFSVSIWDIFIQNNAIISLLKTTG